jgi:hypothetical protein
LETHQSIRQIVLAKKLLNEAELNRVLNLDAFVDTGMVDPEDLKLWHWSDSVDDAFDYLTRELNDVHLRSPNVGYDETEGSGLST